MLPDPKGKRRGECLTLNTLESPNDAAASSLSQVLMQGESIHPRYFLSARACQGILNRAAKRGKELPKSLKEALVAQAKSNLEAESQ